MTPTRTAALVAGTSLAAMAVLGPLLLLVALPADATGLAAVLVLATATLDVVAGIALVPVLSPGGELLAKLAAATRIAYAAAFAAAAGFLLGTAEPERFTAAWEAALLVFGVHLVLVGVALVRSSRAPTPIGLLVVVAGAGYLIDAIGAALAAPTAVGIEFAQFTFVGEVVLLVWLLGWAGRSHHDRPLPEPAGRRLTA